VGDGAHHLATLQHFRSTVLVNPGCKRDPILTNLQLTSTRPLRTLAVPLRRRGEVKKLNKFVTGSGNLHQICITLFNGEILAITEKTKMLILLIILILVFGFGGYRMGPGIGYYGGGGISLILLIVLILLLLKVI
jgi:hypothetical protein